MKVKQESEGIRVAHGNKSRSELRCIVLPTFYRKLDKSNMCHAAIISVERTTVSPVELET